MKDKYLSAYIPTGKKQEAKKQNTLKSQNRLETLEESVNALNDLLAKQNRDNLDALYNIDMDNMSSSLRKLFQSYDDGITSAQASIEAWASETEAGFSAIAKWQKTVEDGTIDSIASINAKADENASQITLLNQWKNTAVQSIASVQTTASQNEAKITSLTSWQSTTNDELDSIQSSVAYIEQVADDNGASISQIVEAVGSNGKVTAASIVSAVNESGSKVMISADKVDISGFVTFESLETDGESTINGNNISLIADSYGDSISSLNYYKWRYTDDTEEDHTLSKMFTIKTIDNESDDDNLARYAAVLQTFRTREDSDYYSVALKLISYGSMSMESGGSVYMEADTYCTISAPYNTRIYAKKSYANACMDIGYAVANYSYVFCGEGIYYVDGSGGASLIVST